MKTDIIKLQKQKISQQYKSIVLISIIPLSIILKFVEFMILGDRIAYDSEHVLDLVMTHPEFAYDPEGFNNAAWIFDRINFFNFTTLIDWSIFLTVVGDIFLFYYISRLTINDILDLVMVFGILSLLNLIVFNISKDIIQFAIFACIWLCIKTDRINNPVKVAIITVLFIIESVLFRSYYILTAAFFFVIALLFLKLPRIRLTILNVLCGLLVVALLLIIFLRLAQMLFPEEYLSVLSVRDNLNYNRDANTAIVNVIPVRQNDLIFTIDYFINAVRTLFPVELIPKGPYYYLFIIFQIMCSVLLFRTIASFSTLKPKYKIAVAVMCAYYMVAFLFEPDFGGFVRHEAATAPVLLMVLLASSKTNTSENIGKTYEGVQSRRLDYRRR